jgi:hypothetical protein
MDKLIAFETGRDDEIVNKLNVIIKTEARHRGMIISNAETVNFFLALLISAAKSKDKDDLEERFNKYFPQSLGEKIGIFRDMKPIFESKLSDSVLSPFIFDEIMAQLDEVCDERNRMAHATSNRFQEIIDKDISILHTTSFYLYQKDKNKLIEKMKMTDEDCKRILNIVNRLQYKILLIKTHGYPKSNTSEIDRMLVVE